MVHRDVVKLARLAEVKRFVLPASETCRREAGAGRTPSPAGASVNTAPKTSWFVLQLRHWGGWWGEGENEPIIRL